MKFYLASLVATIIISPLSCMADALPIESGLWEITSTTKSNIIGTRTETNQQCIKEDELDPAKLMKDAEGCHVADTQLKGDTLTFLMKCNIQGGEGSVEGIFTTSGGTAEGAMKIQMEMGGITMDIESSWDGSRIGDC